MTAFVLTLCGAALACGLELLEALAIVLAVGSTRTWRDAVIGAAGAVALLAVVVVAVGPLLLARLPLGPLKVVIGVALLLFGLEWLRKGVLRLAGRRSPSDSFQEYLEEREALEGMAAPEAGRPDWPARIVAGKGVLLEGVEVVGSLDELLPEADHLVLAAPATPRTRHLINAETLALVKPGVHLVNIARGALVDQDALRVALDDGRVAMATLDTVDPEPLPEGHWLYSHPKVRLSAHVSWASPAGMARTLEIFVDNLRRYAAGEQVLHVVDADEGY